MAGMELESIFLYNKMSTFVHFLGNSPLDLGVVDICRQGHPAGTFVYTVHVV